VSNRRSDPLCLADRSEYRETASKKAREDDASRSPIDIHKVGRIFPSEIQLAVLLGTFLPLSRAFDKPIAIACLRLLTFPPLPRGPLRASPRSKRRISFFTSLLALREYLRVRIPINAL
jgi:hypothetical protein